MRPVLDLEMVCQSDKGLERTENQDSVLVDPRRGLFILADGVGGGKGGATASRLTVDTMEEVLRSFDPSPVETQHVGSERDTARLSDLLREAARASNRAVLDRAASRPDLAGMASTLAAGVVVEARCVAVSAGDSRIYRHRQGRLEQISEDHNLARSLVSDGFLSEEESQVEKYKNVLTRAVGIQDAIEVSTYNFSLETDDIVLACTDGLTNMVGQESISAVLGAGGSLRNKAKELIRLANAAGGRDNISVVIAGHARPAHGLSRATDKLRRVFKGNMLHA